MRRKYLYHIKYWLSRSLIISLLLSVIFLYIRDDIREPIPIIACILLFWLVIYGIRDALRGGELIKDATKLDSGSEDEQGIYQVIEQAKDFLYIVSPYFSAGENHLRVIKDAKKRNVKTVLLVRKDGLQKNSISELKKLEEEGCVIYTHPNLHSKIFLNESVAIIGSMNLLKGSIDNSLEVGIRIKDKSQHKELLDLIEETYLKDSSTKPFNSSNIKMGYCIRSHDEIVFDVNRPIQYLEYKSTNERDGKFCHKCGKAAETSVPKPLCDDCSQSSPAK